MHGAELMDSLPNPYKGSGRWYIEFTVGPATLTNGGFRVGVRADAYPGNIIGQDFYSMGWADNGEVIYDAGPVDSLTPEHVSAFHPNHILGLGIDITNKRLNCYHWFPGGSYAFEGAYPMDAAVFPAISIFNSGVSCIVNCGASPFAMPVPPGFNAGWYNS